MKALINCERSERVREAFEARGWDAWSCDLADSERPASERHIKADAIETAYDRPWDLMICFPPCTYLAGSGLHWNKRGRDPQLTEKALEFVRLLLAAPIPRIALENPVGCISTRIRKPEQIIQPWQFGHPESKKTCLWLKNLPLLVPTNVLPLPECGYWNNQTPSRQNKLGPSPTRAIDRARTYQGIADAMAEQWTSAIFGRFELR